MSEAVVPFDTAVLMQEEVSYGDGVDSANATEQVWIEFTSESLTESHDTHENIDTRARVRRNYANQGQITSNGSVEFDVNAENIGWPIYGILGDADVPTEQTAGEGDYKHKLYVHQATSPSWGLEVDYGFQANDTGKEAYGARISSVSIELAQDTVTCSFDVDAQRLNEDVSTTTQTFTNWPRAFDFKDFKMEVKDTGDTLQDKTIAVDSGTITIESDNLTDDYRQRDQYVHSIPAGPISVSMDLTIVYDDGETTDFHDFLKGDRTDVEVVVTYTGEQIASGNNFEMKFTLPHALTTDRTPEASGPGERVERTVTIEDYFEHGATTEGMEVELTNERGTSYKTS